MIQRICRKLYYILFLQPNKLNVTFVVSTGRTGTKLFETFFEVIDTKIYSVHEPKPDFFDLYINKLRKGWSKSQIINYIVEKRKVELYKMITKRQKVYIECNPNNFYLLSELKECFPRAKFIVITREPKGYVKSALNKSPISNNAKMLFYADNDGRKRISALDFADDKYNESWKGFSRLERICWFWSKCNSILLDFHTNNHSICQHISFEKLFKGEREVKINEIYKIGNFLNLDLKESQVSILLEVLKEKKNSTKHVLLDGYNSWTKQEKDSFHLLTDEMNQKIEILNSKS